MTAHEPNTAKLTNPRDLLEERRPRPGRFPRWGCCLMHRPYFVRSTRC